MGAILTSVAFATNVPIGCILPFAKSYTNCPAMPPGWAECDGTVLNDARSVFNGQALPDLNTTKRMVRGSSTSGTTGGADSHIHKIINDYETNTSTKKFQITNSVNSYNTIFNSSGVETGLTTSEGGLGRDAYTNSQSSLSAYYELVYIMRIW
jgi:hypothetical protein